MPMPDEDLPPDETGMDDAIPSASEPPPEPTHEEMAQQYVKHCMSHPYAKKLSAHYAMEDTPAEEPPLGDPTDTPSADEEMPDAYGAYLSGTNGSLPDGGAPDKKPAGIEKYRKGGHAAMYKRLQDMEIREARRVGETWVQRLADIEGFDLDEDEEIGNFALHYRKGGDDGCAKYAERIRRFHKQRIDYNPGRVPVAASAPMIREEVGAATVAEFDPQRFTEAECEQVLQYQRQHPEVADDFHAAARAWHGARRGKASTNGRRTKGG